MTNQNKTVGCRDGFTLIEIMIAVVLIGIAIAALVTSSTGFTQVNAGGIDLSTAEFLIEQVRERTTSLGFDDLAAFAGTYSPPEDVQGNELADFSQFSQQVTVLNVSGEDFTTAQAGSPFIRITVTILRNGKQLDSANWVRTRS